MRKLQHQEKLNLAKTRLVSGISFLFGFADAFVIYVVSSYFREVSGTDNVSLFYLLTFGIFLVALLFLQSWARRFGTALLLFLFLIFGILASATLILLDPSWLTVIVLMIHLVVSNLIWVNLDIMLESFSEDGKSGRIRGWHLTVVNIGWLLAPMLSTGLLIRSGFSGIFFVSLILYAGILVASLLSFRRTNKRLQMPLITPKQLLRKVRDRGDIMRVYFIALAVEFFYAAMIVYAPFYLLNLGYEWRELGVIFTVMLVPFVLVQYPIGLLADKRFGEKEMLILSLALMIASTACLPFLAPGSVLVWSVAFFFTRLGAAGADILRDSYFYKRIGPADIDLIAFFRTARPVANIAAAAIIGIALLLFPLSSVFFITAVILFCSLIPAISLADNRSEREVGICVAE